MQEITIFFQVKAVAIHDDGVGKAITNIYICKKVIFVVIL